MIYRIAVRERGFTQIDNQTIRDSQLSFKARGILAWLLSHPDDKSISAAQIAAAATEGREAIRKGLRELEEAGYLVRDRIRHPSGRFEWQMSVHEVPDHRREPVDGVTSTNSKPAGGTIDGFPATVNHLWKPVTQVLKTEVLEDQEQKTKSEVLKHSLKSERDRHAPIQLIEQAWTQTFEDFWRTYPRKIGKQAARRAWDKRIRDGTPAHQLIAAASTYATWTSRFCEPRYVKHPATWLNAGCETDELEEYVEQQRPSPTRLALQAAWERHS